MNNASKIIVFIVICFGLWCAYDRFAPDNIKLPEFLQTHEDTEILTPEDQQPEEQKPKAKEEEKKPEKVQETKVYAYMLTTDKSGNQFLKPVSRPLPPNQDKLTYAVQQLFAGPNSLEVSNGVYSEIPSSVKLLGITNTGSKIVINVSSAFEQGGGSDSIYSRMRQLIKTSLANADKPVYLYIEGRQADVIGGEGISISQPLSEKSLDE